MTDEEDIFAQLAADPELQGDVDKTLGRGVYNGVPVWSWQMIGGEEFILNLIRAHYVLMDPMPTPSDELASWYVHNFVAQITNHLMPKMLMAGFKPEDFHPTKLSPPTEGAM